MAFLCGGGMAGSSREAARQTAKSDRDPTVAQAWSARFGSRRLFVPPRRREPQRKLRLPWGGRSSRMRSVKFSRPLYRHFPTREALFEAVYRREVQQLADLAEQLKQEAKPIDALLQWMRSIVKFVATKKSMSAALTLAVDKNSKLFSSSADRLARTVGALLDRAIAAGEIRDDISPEDLLRAVVGMCYMHDQPGWQSVLRLVDVFVDGLRKRRNSRS